MRCEGSSRRIRSLATFSPFSLSSKYYWRQFASQYLTKLIRSAVGGKRGHSRWRTPERIFCPIGRLESVYFNAIDRDGSVCLYCKQKLNKQRRTFECSEEIYLSRCGDIESLRALLSYAFSSGCYSFYSSAWEVQNREGGSTRDCIPPPSLRDRLRSFLCCRVAARVGRGQRGGGRAQPRQPHEEFHCTCGESSSFHIIRLYAND